MDATISFRELIKAVPFHHENGVSLVTLYDPEPTFRIIFGAESADAAELLASTINGLIAKRDAPIATSRAAALALVVAASQGE